MTNVSLGSLIEGLSVEPIRGAQAVVAQRLVEDSRAVRAGDVFLARSGASHPSDHFVATAEFHGAVCIMSDSSGCAAAEGPALRSDNLARDGAILANRLLGDPSKSLHLIGVTGTNGKTTVSTMLQYILSGQGPCGLMGGISINDGKASWPATLTTPMADQLAQWLAQCVQTECESAVMEVSSHAIDQQRIAGLHFAAAAFTNLSGDHLDYHGSMDAYAQCKRSLFQSLDSGSVACTNLDDPRGLWMVQDTDASVLGVSLETMGDVRCDVKSITPEGSSGLLQSPWGAREWLVPMPGRHNITNAMQALAMACSHGHPFDNAIERISQCNAPQGRLQRVEEGSTGPTVLVDFAHTDGALTTVLAATRETLKPHQELILVFGCGGDRDRLKRPRMGRVASELAHRVWVTSDNPRSESPTAIIDDILQGVVEHTRVNVEPDRAAAIKQAIASAQLDDVVLIAGKGHEQVQLIGDRVEPFDDVEIARACLQEARSA
ncbi:MAG: UDP-N-acetylmuramoyl-L-alanyl-D-glutamate--2,6-diaminopimelate ligase [Phycisphaerales bacterium]|nr:UDP-N-acetylmuramoyl-L-alanyl-D-glutamate--2,6-diaminopimelate ligase [Phycisphaerales bacterium]